MARDNNDNYFSLLSARLSVDAGITSTRCTVDVRSVSPAGMFLVPLFSPLNRDTSAIRKLLSAIAFITRFNNKGTLPLYVVIQLRSDSSTSIVNRQKSWLILDPEVKFWLICYSVPRYRSLYSNSFIERSLYFICTRSV